MARRPFFSGNYGSALGSTANAANLIAQAGATQGQMYANLGAQIGNMIQQYGFNKEKQKEDKATIKSSVGILERMKKLDPQNESQYMMQIEQLNNEDMGLGMRAKLADKALQGLSITSQLQGQILSNREKEQNVNLIKQNQEIKQKENSRREDAYRRIDNQINELNEIVSMGASYDSLPSHHKFLLANQDQISQRTIPLEDLIFDPSAEVDHSIAKANLSKIQQSIKLEKKKEQRDKKESEINIAKSKLELRNLRQPPQFQSRTDAIVEFDKLKSLGFKGKLERDGSGYSIDDIEYDGDTDEIPSIPGYDNYKIIGGAVYEMTPGTKTIKKVSAENFGQNTDLLGSVINTLNTDALQRYEKIKTFGERDGDFYVYTTETGDEITAPYNEEMERRLDEVIRLRQQMLQSVDLDLTTR
jgi:hypothetical protein